jgi:hypothetical protein
VDALLAAEVTNRGKYASQVARARQSAAAGGGGAHALPGRMLVHIIRRAMVRDVRGSGKQVCRAVQCSAVPCSAVQCSAVQCSAVQL